MREVKGDIWEFYYQMKWIVIPTNIGWKKDNSNPMGSGIAKQAAEMFPDLPYWFGERCIKYRSETAVAPYEQGRLFIFPTKPLDEDKPWMSWSNVPSAALISRSAKQLMALVKIFEKTKQYNLKEIAIPLLGCGYGELKKADVMPLLNKYFDDRFVLFSNKK